jgi:SAM-dependent methyltransferase
MHTFSITVQGPGARDVGFALAKHPDNVSVFDDTTVWFSESDDDRCTVHVMTGADTNVPTSWLAQTTARRLPRVFATALGGKTAATRQEFNTCCQIPVLASSPSRVRAAFLPLGYDVDAVSIPSAVASCPDVGLVSVTLSAVVSMHDLLRHLAVIVPALERSRHLTPDAVDAVIRRGEGWLPTHPLVDVFCHGLFRRRDEAVTAISRICGGNTPTKKERRYNARGGLQTARVNWVAAQLVRRGCRSILDIGCGSGDMGAAVMRRIEEIDPGAEMRWVGIESGSMGRVNWSRARHNLSSVHQADALNPPDAIRFMEFDAVVAAEFVEHVEKDVVTAGLRRLIHHFNPRVALITTPNGAHELSAIGFRHPDHKWEDGPEEIRETVAALSPPGWCPEFFGIDADGFDTGASHGVVLHRPGWFRRWWFGSAVEPLPEPIDTETTRDGDWAVSRHQLREGLGQYLQADPGFPFVPPTIPPAGSDEPDRVETVSAALRRFANAGVMGCSVQVKHMGSRCVVEVVGDRVRAWSRSGRRYPTEIESGMNWIVDSVKERGWTAALIDGELLPWTVTAGPLLRDRYALIATAGSVVNQALDGVAVPDVVTVPDVSKYTDVVNRFAPADQNTRFVPFAVVATRSPLDSDHIVCPNEQVELASLLDRRQHMYAYRCGTTYSKEESEHVAEWLDYRVPGAEGVVVKAMGWTPDMGCPPALKVRAQDYLEIIYGPGFDTSVVRRRRTKQKEKRARMQELAMRRAVSAWTRGDTTGQWALRGFAAGIR